MSSQKLFSVVFVGRRVSHRKKHTDIKGAVSINMSTAKRLVLSLTGRKDSQGNAGASSTRLVNSNSPGHELDEIAIVSSCGAGSTIGRVSYGSLSLGQSNGPRFMPGM